MSSISVIFFVADFLPESLTGGAIYVDEIAKRLAKSTHNNVFVITTTKNKRCKRFEITKSNVKVERIYIPLSLRLTILGKMIFPILSIPILIRRIKENNINLIYTSFGPFMAIPAFICAKLTYTKIIAGVHGVAPKDYLIDRHGKIQGPLVYHLQKSSALLPFDKIIAVSNYTRDILVELGVKEDRVVAIPNGVDLERFKPVSSPKINEEVLIGYLGGLIERKGVEFLIRAMKSVIQRIPNTKLLIAGDGIFRDNLEKESKELGIDGKVLFIGMFDEKDKYDIISSFDVVVLPSLSENMPLVMLETMACGKVFIGTNIAAMPEVIKNYVNGILVEPKNVDTLAEAIITVLSNKSLKTRMERNARKTAEQYSWDVTVTKWEKLYQGRIMDE